MLCGAGFVVSCDCDLLFSCLISWSLGCCLLFTDVTELFALYFGLFGFTVERLL